jgi:hypothetical protein
MHPSTYAALTIGGVIALTGMYDYLAWLHWGYEGTLTSVIRDWCRRYPLLPFAGGVLVGHLLWGG